MLFPGGNDPPPNSERGEMMRNHLRGNTFYPEQVSEKIVVLVCLSCLPVCLGDNYSGKKVCMEIAAAEVGRLPSCYKEKFCAGESGCKVGSLELSSSEKKNNSAYCATVLCTIAPSFCAKSAVHW